MSTKTVIIVDGEGCLTLKEFSDIKIKDYFRKCKNITKGKNYTEQMIEVMAEDIRDVICPCCLDKIGYFEIIVGIAYKKKMIVLDEDGDYIVCVDCLMRRCGLEGIRYV